jgi:hypothetical protein
VFVNHVVYRYKDKGMNKTLFLLLCCIAQHSFSQPSRNVGINPTGTYVLKGEKHKREIKGHYGEVRAKLIDDSLLAIAMYSNTGYPAYNSVSFTDTIPYSDNRAVYTSKYDPSCQLVFAFETGGLSIKQIYTDPASTCGFGKGVMLLGFIAKYSSDVPIIQPLVHSR